MAQTEVYKEDKLFTKMEMSGDIHFAWEYLSNLGNLQHLFPSTVQQSVAKGNGKGSLVTLTITNGKGTIVEEVVELDNHRRYIAYKMVKTPLPVRDDLASFEIKGLTKTRFEVTFVASYKVEDSNRQVRWGAFKKLQFELLDSLKAKVAAKE